MKILRLLFFGFVIFLASCGQFHEVTFQVESSGAPALAVAGISWTHGSTISLYSAKALPFTEINQLRHVEVGLTADTYMAVDGAVTVSIFVDGVLFQTGTATAAGVPATVTISAYIPN